MHWSVPTSIQSHNPDDPDLVAEVIEGTVFEKADSWYVGTNVRGKKQEILAYAGGIVRYIEACAAA